ncbi:MAG: DUF4785 domain-containing protein [Acidobacteriota bacterium]
MRRLLTFVLLAAAAASFAGTRAGSDPVALSPAFLATPAEAAEAGLFGSVDRTPLADVRPVAYEALLPEPPTHVAESREFWRRVSAEDLREGVEFAATAPEAVVRLSPVESGAPWVSVDRLLVGVPSGQTLTAHEAFARWATPEHLRQAGAAFPEGTCAFRLAPEAGSGRFRLSAPGLDAPEGSTYLLHVLDARSDLILSLQAGSDTVFRGGGVSARAWLAEAGSFVAGISGDAEISSPDGRRWSAEVRSLGDGSVRVDHPLRVSPAERPGLWEVHLRVTADRGGERVQRDVHTAFAYVVPTARPTGDVRLAVKKGSLALRAPVETAAPGRYALQCMVWATDGTGERRPMARVETAVWLEEGRGVLRAEIPAGLIREGGFHPPYEVRDIRLVDQSRLFLLYRN